jgi:copper oxidase (laccase) domain-containing protein
MVWHEDSGLHGILHAGILPALNGIVRNLGSVLTDLQVPPGDVRAYLGPSISKRNYDVTRSGLWLALADQIEKAPSLQHYLREYFDGRFFDVPGLVMEQLEAIGLKSEGIAMYTRCTGDRDSLFFSNYAAKHFGMPAGGFCSVIW